MHERSRITLEKVRFVLRYSQVLVLFASVGRSLNPTDEGTIRPSPPTCDRDRSRLSLWWDAGPQAQRVALVLTAGLLFNMAAGLLARL